MLVLPLLFKPKTFDLLRFVASRIAVNFDGLPPFSTKFCHKYATRIAPWPYVRDVTYDQNFLQAMFGVSSVTVSPTNERKLVPSNVVDGERTRETIWNLVVSKAPDAQPNLGNESSLPARKSGKLFFVGPVKRLPLAEVNANELRSAGNASRGSILDKQ
jgi:hypothetical protein